MAILHSNTNTFSTNGEEYIYNNILSLFTDDWHIFHEPLINGKKPDFVIFNSSIGITILEVKDYNKNTIVELTPKFWGVNVNGITKTLTSPVEQAIGYRNELINLLGKDRNLHSDLQNYKGKLKVPISTICCFPNISNSDSIYSLIRELIPDNMLVIKEDLIDSNNFLQKVLISFEKLFSPEYLSKQQKNDILHYIFPRFKFEQTFGKNNGLNIGSFVNNLPYKKFNNYVDELIFIADMSSHWINQNNISAQDAILIVYNKKRSSFPIVSEYIKLLKNLLLNKNIKFNMNKWKNEMVQLITYEEFRESKKNKGQKIIFADFNTISFNTIKNVFLENPTSYFSIIITSNEHIPL